MSVIEVVDPKKPSASMLWKFLTGAADGTRHPPPWMGFLTMGKSQEAENRDSSKTR